MALQENVELAEEMQNNIQKPEDVTQEQLVANLNMVNKPVPIDEGIQVAQAAVPGSMTDASNLPTLEQRTDMFDIRDEIEAGKRERLAERLKYEMLPNARGHLYRDYGSFSSTLDINNQDVKVTVTPQGELLYSGVYNTISTNPAVVGQDNTTITSYPLPDNMTREALIDAAFEQNQKIRNSGDLTYDPDRDFFKGDGLLAVKLAEETTVVQGLRGIIDASPMGLLAANSKAWDKFAKFAKSPPSLTKLAIKTATGVPTVALGYYLLEQTINKYGDDPEKLDQQGWVSLLYDLQEAELDVRNSEYGRRMGFGYDPDKVNTGEGIRTFTKEQYAALLDPAFASFYVKLANTVTENVASVLSFGYLGGSMKISPWNTNNINKLRTQAMENVQNISRKRVEGGFKPLSFDPTTKEGKANIAREMGNIIDRELNTMKNQVTGGIFRFVNGFNKTQIKQQLENNPRYWFEVGAGETVGSGLQALAAYYSWGSDRTMTVDKMPYLIVGGMFGPWTLAKTMTGTFGGKYSPVKYATDVFRKVAEDTEGYARSMLAKTSYLSYIDQDPKAIPMIIDFLQGKPSTPLPTGMTNDQKSGLIKLKEQLGLIDDEMSGSLLSSMQIGLEQAQTAKEIAAKYGITLNIEETIGTFVKLQVIQGLEKYLVESTIKGSKADITTYNKAKEDLLTLRSQALSETNELLDKMLRVTEEGGSDVSLDKLVKGLQSEIVVMEKSNAERLALVNQAFAIQIQDAFRALQKNPYNTDQISKVKYLLSTDLGKELKISFDGIDIPTEEMIKQIDNIITNNLDQAYEAALDGRRPVNLITGGDEVVNFNTGDTLKDSLLKKDTNLQGGRILSRAEAQEVSGNFFAGSMQGNMNSNKSKVDTMYKQIFSDADAEQDVSNLYIDVTNILDNIDSAAFTGTRNVAESNVFQFFNDALNEGTNNYFKRIGAGSISDGKKQLGNILKDKDIKNALKGAGIQLSAEDLNNPKKLAKVMLSNRVLEDTEGVEFGGMTQREFLAGMLADNDVDAFALKIPTLEFKEGYQNIKTDFFTYGLDSAAGVNTTKEFVNQRTLGDVLDAMNGKVDEIYEKIRLDPTKSQLLDSTTKFYKTNIIDAKNNILWRNTMGKISGTDTKSITGFAHGDNAPQAWLRTEIDKVVDDKTATNFWNNFEAVFGTDPTNPYYRNALKAIDDTMTQRMAGKKFTYKSPFPVTGTKELTADSAEKLFSGTIIREGGDALEEDATILTEIASFRKTKELLEGNSQGKFKLGGTINVYEKLKTAAETNKEARIQITETLNRVDDLRVRMKPTAQSVQAGIAEVNKFLTANARGILKVADNNFVGVTDLFMTNPAMLDSTKMHLINARVNKGMTYDQAVEETDAILKNIIGKGISQKFQGSQKQMVAQKAAIEGGQEIDTGIVQPKGTYLVMEMEAYLNQHQSRLQEILGKEHFNDIKFITNYMARNGYTTEVDAASKFKLTEGYQSRVRGNMVYGPASIISRLYAAESGRTSYRYIGAEAVAAMMVNSKHDVLGAIFTNGDWSRGVKEFLADPKMPSSYAKQKRIVWLEELAAYSSIIGEAEGGLIYGVFSEEEGDTLPDSDYLREKLGIDTSNRPEFKQKDVERYKIIDGKRVLVKEKGESEDEIGDRISKGPVDAYGNVDNSRLGTDIREAGRRLSEFKRNLEKFNLPNWLKDQFMKMHD